MRKTELQSIEQKLILQRSAILNKNIDFMHNRKDFSLFSKADEAEIANHDIEVSMTYQIQERDRELIMKIDKALSKMSHGSFGECESCGAEITTGRLNARPFAELCIECQEEQEEGKGFPI